MTGMRRAMGILDTDSLNRNKTKVAVSWTSKQKRFVEEYCVDFNATQAAIRAGYSEKTAGQMGHENLNKPHIREAVDDRLQQLRASSEIPLKQPVFDALMGKFGDIDRAAKAIERIALSALEDGEKLNLHHRNHIDGTNRYDVLYRAGFKCQACGARPTDTNNVELEVDHIVPHSWGGSDDPDNLQCLCKRCNASKGNRYAYDHNKGQLLIPFD